MTEPASFKHFPFDAAQGFCFEKSGFSLLTIIVVAAAIRFFCKRRGVGLSWQFLLTQTAPAC
jgi:hypothetical protein